MKQRFLGLSGVTLTFAAAMLGCGDVPQNGPDGSPAPDSRTPDADAAIDGPEGPWNPGKLPGIALWLAADTGVTTNNSRVSTWADRSGNNNNAAQSVSARQPTLVTGVVNGQPVIRFDGTDDALQVNDSATLHFATDDFTIAVVAGFQNPTANVPYPYAALVSKQVVASPYRGPSLWANYPVPSVSTTLGLQLSGEAGYHVPSSSDGYNDGGFRLYSGRRTGGTHLEVRVDGVSEGATDAPTALDISATGEPLFVGGHVTTGNDVIQALLGDMAEVVAVHGPISEDDLAKLEAYLKAKYALH